MTLKPRCGGGLKVVGLVEPCQQEVVGKCALLLQAVSATHDFKIAPALVLKLSQVVFLPELIRNIGGFDVGGGLDNGLKI